MSNQPLFEHPGSWKPTNPYPVEWTRGPWPSVAAACAAVEEGVRYDSLTVMIAGVGEYWWLAADLSDTGLIPKSTPGNGGGAPGTGGQRGTYLSLPGRYSAGNATHALPANTVDVDLVWGSGRPLEPTVDYQLDLATTPPTVTILADLAAYEGERLWGRTYRGSTRTYLALEAAYGPAYAAAILPPGTADVSVFWGSGRELEPGVDYTFDAPTRTLTLLADTALYGGERLWLWLYS